MIEKITKRDFVRIGEVWVPLDVKARPQLYEDPCPHHGELISVRRSKMGKRAFVDIEVANGSGDYCWNRCDVETCPSYKANKQKPTS